MRDGQAGADDSPPDFRFQPFQEAMDHDADDVLGQEAAVDVDEPQIAGDPPEEIRNDDGMDEDEAVGLLTRCVTFAPPSEWAHAAVGSLRVREG